MEEAGPCDQNPGREEALGLAQTTSTILRSDLETDRQMGYLDPSALGREKGRLSQQPWEASARSTRDL